MNRLVQLGISSFLSMALAGCLLPNVLGCSVLLSGAGEYGMGYDSRSTVFVYHTVDGDKMDKKARSELNVEALVDLVVKLREDNAEVSETESVDSSSD